MNTLVLQLHKRLIALERFSKKRERKKYKQEKKIMKTRESSLHGRDLVGKEKEDKQEVKIVRLLV